MLRKSVWIAVLCLGVVLAAAGCTPSRQADGDGAGAEMAPLGSQELPSGIREYNPAELDSVLEGLWSNSNLWHTLTAKCRVTIRSPRIRGAGGPQGNVIELQDVELSMFKGQPVGSTNNPPQSILKMSLRGGDKIVLVSDGRDYYVRIPALQQEYAGTVGQPHSSGRPRIEPPVLPIRPDDIGKGLAPWAAFWNRVQVIKQDISYLEAGNRLVEILSLDFAGADTPEARIRVSSTLLVDRESRHPMRLYAYGPQDAPRAIIVYGQFQEGGFNTVKDGKVQPGPPVTLAKEIWVGFPETASSIRLQLSEIRINVPISPAMFDLVDSVD